MKRKLHQSSRIVLRIALAGGAVLLVSCAYLVHRGRETLVLLTRAPEEMRTTDIFSRWIELAPSAGVTRTYLLGYLPLTGYSETPNSPVKAGEFQRVGEGLDVYLRGFSYPDKEFPAQRVRIRFEHDQLVRLETAAGNTLPSWRLEPRRIGQWASTPEADRPRTRLTDLPPYVPGAVLAVEDKRFYHHLGFDWIGIVRALWVDVRQGSVRQGASTISQQLARSVFLDARRTWKRKLLEASLAFYLEMRFTKPQLLEMYLNQVYWGQEGGESLLGIESVSRSYFNKPARSLTVAESALLAGLLHSPNRLSPRAAPGAAIERRNRVLKLMLEQAFITPAVYAHARSEPLHLTSAKRRSNDAAYFLSSIRETLEETYSAEALSSQGWRIFTTLDPVFQQEAVEAVRSLRTPPPSPQAALVALEPMSRAIRAWVGGTDFATAPFDRVIHAPRQPGSAFKPLIVLAAVDARKATGATILEDRPLTLRGQHGDWSPRNYDRVYRGQVNVRDSLVHSWNVPIVRLAMQVGLPAIVSTAHRAGIESALREDLSLALGSSETTVLELTNAYATLASGGWYAEPYRIESIVTPDGALIEKRSAHSMRVFEEEPVFLVTQMLQAVFDEGTAVSARKQGFAWSAAGKTGTSENFLDAWFVGYTPELVCGVWVGHDQPKSLGRSAASIALPVWTSFMNPVLRDMPPPAWKLPINLLEKTIDPESGQLARSGCPARRKQLFMPGTEPTEDCSRHPGGLTGWFRRLTSGSTTQK